MAPLNQPFISDRVYWLALSFLWVYRCCGVILGKPQPFQDKNDRLLPGSISEKIWGNINGLEQVRVKDNQLLASQPGMEMPFDLCPIRQDAFEVYLPSMQQPIFTTAFLRNEAGKITFMNFGYCAFQKVE